MVQSYAPHGSGLKDHEGSWLDTIYKLGNPENAKLRRDFEEVLLIILTEIEVLNLDLRSEASVKRCFKAAAERLKQKFIEKSGIGDGRWR